MNQEVSSIEFERFKNYHVQIDANNWFEIDGLLFNSKVRVVNIRSVHGHIDGHDFDRTFIEKEIHDYLTTKTNVELINILSRQYNHANWFDVYENDQENDLDQWRRKEILSDISHAPAGACGFKTILILPDSHLKPNEVYRTAHFLQPDIKYETFSVIPIYHINGSRKARANTTEHLTHFDILIHLLMKKFVSFKSKILHLAGIEVQVAQGRGKPIEEYMNMKNSELVQIIMKQKEMNKSRDQACKRLYKHNHDLQRTLTEIKSLLNDQTNKLDVANKQLEDQTLRLTIANNKIDRQTNLITGLQDLVVENAQATRDKINELGNNLHRDFTRMNVTTGSRAETIDLWTNAALDQYFHNQGWAEENEEVLDTFAGDGNHPERIKQHTYPSNHEIDECLGSFPNANAIDICVYAQEHMHEYPHLRFYSPSRKLIVQGNHREEAIAFIRNCTSQGDNQVERLVQNYQHESLNVFGNLITRLQTMMNVQQNQLTEIHQDISEQRNQTEELHDEVKQIHEDNIQIHEDLKQTLQTQEELHEEIHELKTEIQVLREIINLRLPGAKQIWFNRSYRDIEELEGRLVCSILKTSNDKHILTEEELKNLKLR